VKHFSSDGELLRFARKFANRHVERFEKDIAICLTGKSWKSGQEVTHAYFPALMACIGFMDFFSGLYCGTLKSPTLDDLKNYARRFLPPEYSDNSLTIFYHCFRHKIAHLAHPYDVLDTRKVPSLSNEPSMRVTWEVDEKPLSQSITLETLETPQLLKDVPSGWDVTFDHRMHVSIPKLANDAIQSVCGDSGYLHELASNQDCRSKFEYCMNQYFSP
jgi:hypothetical protein